MSNVYNSGGSIFGFRPHYTFCVDEPQQAATPAAVYLDFDLINSFCVDEPQQAATPAAVHLG